MAENQGWDQFPTASPPPTGKPSTDWDQFPVAAEAAPSAVGEAAKPTPNQPPPINAGDYEGTLLGNVYHMVEAARRGIPPDWWNLSKQTGQLQHSLDELHLAVKQRVNPNATSPSFGAEDYSSSPLAKAEPSKNTQLVGHLDPDQDIANPNLLYTTPKGEHFAFNPNTDFVATDPKTGKQAVYARNPQAEESPVVGAAREITPYILAPIAGTIRTAEDVATAATAAARRAGRIAPYIPTPATEAERLAQYSRAQTTGPLTEMQIRQARGQVPPTPPPIPPHGTYGPNQPFVPTEPTPGLPPPQVGVPNEPNAVTEAARLAQPEGVPGTLSEDNPIGAARVAEELAKAEQDQQSFKNLDIPAPGITFASGPMRGLGQMISRIPFIGAPIVNSLNRGLIGARNVSENISRGLAADASPERAGQVLQGALERYRGAGVSEIEPGILTEMGIQPRAPGPYLGDIVDMPPIPGQVGPNTRMILRPDGTFMPLEPEHVVLNEAGRRAAYAATGRANPLMSAGAAERETAAAPIREAVTGSAQGYAYTSRGHQVASARPYDLTMMGRRSAEDLSDAELQALLRQPSNLTSFMARAEALYEKAWRNLPRLFDVRGRANYASNAVDATNTRAALAGIERQIANQISGQGAVTGELAGRISNPQGGQFTINELRAIRTEVGRQIGNLNPMTSTLSGQQLNGLYHALTNDMEVGVRDISNRAYNLYREEGAGRMNIPNATNREQVMRSDQALRDFRVADRYYRLGQFRMQRFSKLLGTDNPNQAAKFLVDSTKEGMKGNMGLVRNALNVLRPEERNTMAALVLNELGKPMPSSKGLIAEAGFSPSSMMTRWRGMDPEAKRMLFGGEYASAMDDLVNVSTRLANQEAMANVSRSGTDIINWITLDGALAMLITGKAPLLAAMVGPVSLFSYMTSKPAYVKLITAYMRAKSAAYQAPITGGGGRMAALTTQVAQLAKRDPGLIPFQNALAAEPGVQPGDERKQNQRGNPRPYQPQPNP